MELEKEFVWLLCPTVLTAWCDSYWLRRDVPDKYKKERKNTYLYKETPTPIPRSTE